MSTKQVYKREEILSKNTHFSNIRSIIESAFYGNNVKKISLVAEAYHLSFHSRHTTVTDLDVYKPEVLGIPANAKVLLENDGKVTGRTAAARRILGQPGVDAKELSDVLREAIYLSQSRDFYKTDVIVGLDKAFMVKAHMMIPKDFENNLYSYVLNFQIVNDVYEKMYQTSVSYDESDIFVFCDPHWAHPNYPHGLVVFDAQHNSVAILGLRYFGELKKATLTLAWSIGHRNGFIACHGGMKQYHLNKTHTYTMAAFGLSGSGKSTITLAKHDGKYDITVLHDDAFLIDERDGSTTALEPAYFDKTQDYPMTSEAIKYFLTVQNVGVTLDDEGKKVLVTEDIRNGNGRTVKSRLVTPNRVDHLKESINAIFWIMKDDSLPPVIKVKNPILAAVFGATLATKRSTAENIITNVNLDTLVIEPYANPFRVYPLGEDYLKFKKLFETTATDCYILNTGFFNDRKITKEHTLHSIEQIFEKKAIFKAFGPFSELFYLPIEDLNPNFFDVKYVEKVKIRLQDRLDFITSKDTDKEGYDALPSEAKIWMKTLINQL